MIIVNPFGQTEHERRAEVTATNRTRLYASIEHYVRRFPDPRQVTLIGQTRPTKDENTLAPDKRLCPYIGDTIINNAIMVRLIAKLFSRSQIVVSSHFELFHQLFGGLGEGERPPVTSPYDLEILFYHCSPFILTIIGGPHNGIQLEYKRRVNSDACPLLLLEPWRQDTTPVSNQPLVIPRQSDLVSAQAKIGHTLERNKYIAIFVGSGGPYWNIWPRIASDDFYVGVMEKLQQRYPGKKIVIVDGPDDGRAKRLWELTGKQYVYFKEGFNLGELYALFQGAALIVSNDTGPAHLARATGKPLVVLINDFVQTEQKWYTSNSHQSNLAVITSSYNQLILTIKPEEFLAQAEKILAKV